MSGERCLEQRKGNETFPPTCNRIKDHPGPHESKAMTGFSWGDIWEENDGADCD